MIISNRKLSQENLPSQDSDDFQDMLHNHDCSAGPEDGCKTCDKIQTIREYESKTKNFVMNNI